LEPTDVIVNVVGNVVIMEVLCMSACLVIACNHPRCLRILMCQSSSYVVYGLAMYGLAMMYPFLLQLKCFHLLAPKCLVLTSMYSVKISFTRYCFSTKLYAYACIPSSSILFRYLLQKKKSHFIPFSLQYALLFVHSERESEK